MSEILSLRELQKMELRILVDFDKYCRKHGLRYSLFAGTLIGAVRHGGFIPWDDDIDVCMPRADFRKLIDLLKQEPIENCSMLSPYDEASYFTGFFLKIFDTRTELIEFAEDNFPIKYGVFIDVFPLDFINPTVNDIEKMFTDYHNMLKKHRRYIRKMHSKSLYKKILYKYKVKIIGRLIQKELDNLDNQSNTETGWLSHGSICNSPFGRIYNSDMFADYCEMSFEGHSFSVMKGYEGYLWSRYGNYMQLPPEEERFGHHYIKAYMKGGC